jgi:hypothetical protein
MRTLHVDALPDELKASIWKTSSELRVLRQVTSRQLPAWSQVPARKTTSPVTFVGFSTNPGWTSYVVN